MVGTTVVPIRAGETPVNVLIKGVEDVEDSTIGPEQKTQRKMLKKRIQIVLPAPVLDPLLNVRLF